MSSDTLPLNKNRHFALSIMGGAIILAAFLLSMSDGNNAWLFVVALLMGVSLYHASFGFSAAYRNLFRKGDTRGVDGQIVLLAVTMILFGPVLMKGEMFGQSLGGAIAPVGIGMAFGAFLFGIGMQLGGACASGTLYTAGSGNPRMMLVLVFFCIGAFWGSLDLGWWQELPGIGAVSLADKWGWEVVFPSQLGVLLLLYAGLHVLRRKRQKRRPQSSEQPLFKRLIQGPWPLIWGGISLGFLNLVTLLSAGHPWSITWGFTLWGAKAATLLGWNPMTSDFWASGFQQQALQQYLWQDTTSVMNFGILCGATLAMLLAGRKAAAMSRKWRPIAAAILGGLMLGYGARIAYGCNIGAFISGAASTSLHGWVWILCALPGNWLGMHLRRPFQLD
ncbi:MAG: YeeE/YedE family protein [Sneathiella sp.]